MQFKLLPLLALATAASARSLSEVLTASPDLTTLVTLLQSLPDTLKALDAAKGITLLAPSNDAFATLLSGPLGPIVQQNPDVLNAVLQYHVLAGLFPASSLSDKPAFAPTLLTNSSYANVTGGQRVEAVVAGGKPTFISGLQQVTSVKQADYYTEDPVVHIINSVLTVPVYVSTTAAAANLTTLVNALTNAKLVEAVDQAKDVTVFAPTNAAFEAISSTLSNITVADLTTVLTYHVVAGTVGYSSTLKDGLTLKTLQGNDLVITLKDGSAFVNGIKVLKTDVLVSNGVVHVIDGVLNPSAASSSPSSSSASASASASAATATGSAASSATPPESVSTNAASTVHTGAVAVGLLFGAAALFNY